MELSKGMGRRFLLGLLAWKKRHFSRSALAAAIESWHSRPELPLSQALIDHQTLSAKPSASPETVIHDGVHRQDSNPANEFLTVAVGEARTWERQQVSEQEQLTRLHLAAEPATQADPGRDSMARYRGDEQGAADPTSDSTATENFGDSRSTVEADPATQPVKLPDTTRHVGDSPGGPGGERDTETWSRDSAADPLATVPQAGDGRGTVLPPQAETGTPNSRYRILRPHAEGGLGAVFVAHDEELHREVAVKEILQRHGRNSEYCLRFLLEAEVTGGLEHPGIVPVYGLGRYEDGRPYYAMKFIRGESLKSAIAKFHVADGPDRHPGERAMALRRLLNHFVDVCEAIAYAHSRGVVHRDIKPANVMLGKYGETLVVDWGLAKPLGRCFPESELPATGVFRSELAPDDGSHQPVTLDASAVELPELAARRQTQPLYQESPLIPLSLGRSSETLAGSRIGTPSFMSPEQAAGAIEGIGPASDIYSLGATLYNVLTGRPPFIGTDLLRLLDRVTSGDFPPPRTIKHAIPKALQAIVLKAMALAPGDRYKTAKALGQDIEHWMADEPVSAYREPWLARAGRFARQHKTLVATSGALLVAAVLGLSAGSIVLERERARTEYERALAVKNYRYAYEAAETMLSHVGDVDLADIPQMEGVRLELLKTAQREFQNLLEQHSHDPEILLLEARTRARLGDVQEMLGLYAEAEQNDRTAIDSLELLRDRFPNDDRPLQALARASHELGVLLNKMNRFKEAETALREAVRDREQLAAKSPDDAMARKALSDSRYHLGSLLARLAKPSPEDRELYLQAVKDQEALLTTKPALPENRIKLAQYRNNLAILEARTDPARAEREYRDILELLAGLDRTRAGLPGARWQVARASNNLGTLLAGRDQSRASAEELLLRARDELDRLTAEFPGILQYRRELASIFNNLGRMGQDRKQASLASHSFQQAAKLLEPLATQYPQVPDFRQNLAIVQFQLNLLRIATDRPVAEAALAEVLGSQDRLIAVNPEVPDYRSAMGRNLLDYGKLLFEQGDLPRAADQIEKAVARFQEALRGDPGNRMYIKNLYEALSLQMMIALERKQAQQAATSASLLVDLLPDRLRDYLKVAAGLSKCVGLALQGNDAASGEGTQSAEAYGRRAVELLRKAVQRGLLRSSEPLKLEEFVPLRSRQDFIDLFKELPDDQRPVSG